MKHSYRLSLIALVLTASFVPRADAANEAEERAKRQLALLQKKLDALQQGFAEQEKVLRDANKRNGDLQRELTSAKTVIRWIGANPAALQKIGDAGGGEIASEAAPELSINEPATSIVPGETPAQPGADPAAALAPPAAVTKPGLPLRPEPKPADRPLPAADSGALYDILADPVYLGGSAAVVLGAGVWLWSRRRRKQTPVFEDSLLAHNPPTKNIVIGSTGGAVIDTTLAMNSMFKEEDLGAASLDPSSIDPVAEAEVYLAYGRDSQAEEILLDALSKMPDRQDVRLKLLDIYAARGDLRSFESTLAEMQSIGVNKDDSIWQRVVLLSAGFGPKNPLVGSEPVCAEPLVAMPTAPSSEVLPKPEPQPPAADFALTLDLPTPASAPEIRRPDTIEMALVGGGVGEGSCDDEDIVSLDEDERLGQGLDMLLPDMDIDVAVSAPVDLDAHHEHQTSTSAVVIDLADDASGVPPATVTEHMPVVSRINPDTLLNFDFEFDAAAPADVKAMPQLEPVSGSVDTPPLALDFGGISLDLETAPATVESQIEPEAIELAIDGVSSNEEDPIDIKISLARAYMEMGDRDSANEILQEVLDEGNASQGKLARELLEDMRSAA